MLLILVVFRDATTHSCSMDEPARVFVDWTAANEWSSDVLNNILTEVQRTLVVSFY